MRQLKINNYLEISSIRKWTRNSGNSHLIKTNKSIRRLIQTDTVIMWMVKKWTSNTWRMDNTEKWSKYNQLIMPITMNITKWLRICLQTEKEKNWKMTLASTTKTTKMIRIKTKTPFKSKSLESSRSVMRTAASLVMLNSLQTTPLCIRILLTHQTMHKTCPCLSGEDLKTWLMTQSWLRMEWAQVMSSKEY